jgi:hypothetical protein
MHGRGRVFGRGRPSSHRALPVTNPRSSRELTRAQASSRELMRARAAAASTRSPQPIRWVRRSRGPHYGRRAAAHAAGSPVQSDAIRRNQTQSDAIRRQSLWASHGRPRSWMTCAIRCTQTQSIGNQEAIRGAISGLQRPSEGPSEAIRGESEANQRRSPPCPRDCHLARERRPDLRGEAPW